MGEDDDAPAFNSEEAHWAAVRLAQESGKRSPTAAWPSWSCKPVGGRTCAVVSSQLIARQVGGATVSQDQARRRALVARWLKCRSVAA